jgi:MFS family permease
VLRHADFRRFLIGNLVVTLGSQMQTVAVGWDLYDRTGSALALGGVGLAQVLPVFALTLPAGHVADRFSRKRVLIASQALMIASSLGLALTSATRASVALMYAFLLLLGVGRAFQAPAKDSLAPQLLPPELLPHGATWRSTVFQLAAVLGPALGGLVIALTGHAWPSYLLAAAGAVIFSILIARVEPRPHARGERAGIRETVLGGIQFLRRTRVLLAIITLDMFAVMLGGATALLPIYAKDILGVGPTGLGWMLAAPSVGALLMAFTLTHRPPLENAGRALLWAVTGFGVATILFGISRSFPFSLTMLALLGAFDNVSVVIRSTLLQVLTPDELRGRVAAINSLFIGTSNELGEFESGTLAAFVGPVVAVVIGGIGTIASVVIVGRLWPEVGAIRSMRPQDLETPVVVDLRSEGASP